MAADVAAFRAAFPEFPTAGFPDAQVQFQIDVAEGLTNRQRFGRLADQAVLYLAAHYLATATAQVASIAAGGSAASPPAGAQTGASVGGVSVSNDPSYGAVDGSGLYNGTLYGRQYATWRRMFGAGGFQL